MNLPVFLHDLISFCDVLAAYSFLIHLQLIFYFNVMNYSEKALCEISDKISDELKLLYALNKSDKERFGKLQ